MFSLRRQPALIILGLLLMAPGVRGDASATYLRDLAFIRDTVAKRSWAAVSHGLDWRGLVRDAEPAFRRCRDDATHLQNVLRLVAHLGDPQAQVIALAPGLRAPERDDGLVGCGLWLDVDRGRATVVAFAERARAATALPSGSTLVAVGGEPVWVALERVRRPVRDRFGPEPDHAFWRRVGGWPFRLYGQSDVVGTFLTPAGTIVEVPLIPTQASVSVARVQGLPAGKRQPGLEHATGPLPTGDRALWARPTGGRLHPATAARLREQLDRTAPPAGVVLDLRGIAGAGEAAALAVAALFLDEPLELDDGLTVTPAGKRAYRGPLVVLQDAGTGDAAELLIWALREARRAVTIGHRTSGRLLPTARFPCPSGKLAIELALRLRPTARRQLLPVGEGFVADVELPRGVIYATTPSAALDLALEVLTLETQGIERDELAALFGQLFSVGDVERFVRRGERIALRVRKWQPTPAAARYRADLVATAHTDLAQLTGAFGGIPDFIGVTARLEGSRARLRWAGEDELEEQVRAQLKALDRDEARAQKELLEILDPNLHAAPADAERFLRRRGRTAVGRWAKKTLLSTR